MRPALVILLGFGLIACSDPTARDAPGLDERIEPSSPALVIRHVRLFDGNDVIPNTTVLVRDGLIEAVGPGVTVPEGALVVPGEGRTLLPGLIDAHTHVSSPDDPRLALALGVTSELEMMGDPQLAKQLRGNLVDIAGEQARHPIGMLY